MAFERERDDRKISSLVTGRMTVPPTDAGREIKGNS